MPTYTEQQVELFTITPDAETNIVVAARVSSPRTDKTVAAARLLRYLIAHKHWSPFELGHMAVKIVTTQSVAKQILRHRSFSFQEFSQRYAETDSFIRVYPRTQDLKNRQNSLDNMSTIDRINFIDDMERLNKLQYELYTKWLSFGAAKESARFFLGNNAATSLYMVGSIRSWIHYLEIRAHEDTQREHREIAEKIKRIFKVNLPVIYEALYGEK